MAHDHEHDHNHSHEDLVTNLDVPDEELSPTAMSRRAILRGAGLLGAGAAAASVLGASLPAGADENNQGKDKGYVGGLRWLAGDHHIHTQYSPDAMYRVIDQARHAAAFGLDWIVITDHGSVQHAKIGVDKVNPDIVAARKQLDELLIFQGLEWNIPSAEHGTVIVQPGPNEVAVLKEFENGYDGVVTGTTASNAANEALAVAGIQFLGQAVSQRRIDAALFLANHPARNGLDSPHEFRAWRDTDPSIAVGFEGAPGHQAAGLPTPTGAGGGRGAYAQSPSANSWPGFPFPDSYRTWGGFDWFTSTVGGLWDSLLAEGKPWWISANSDSHSNYLDVAVRGPGSDFTNNGFYNDPVYGKVPVTSNSDFWPGYYSRTHVGAPSASYAQVLKAIRNGCMWVDHGALIAGLDVRVREVGDRNGGTPLGGTLRVAKGAKVELVMSIDLATGPNWSQFVPKLARVDVIAGAITGPAADRDVMAAPGTKVVKSFEVGAGPRVSFTYQFGPVENAFYTRVRGTDGNRTAVGYLGADVDPVGPAIDVLGNADPWLDLWFYANPIFVIPR